MRMSLGPSCSIHTLGPGSIEINICVRGIPAPGINPNLGSDPIPLRERGNNLWMNLLGMTLGFLYQLSFLNVCTPVHGPGHAHSAPQGFSLLEGAAK
jgi:hypothetical protein